MVKLGYLLIVAGFLAGSYFAVLDKAGVPWGVWGLAVAVGVAGVVLARLGGLKSAQAEDRLAADILVIDSSLAHLVEKAEALHGEKGSIDPYDVRHRIDAGFIEDLNAFVEARGSLRHRYGVHAYADVMTAFATGERALNRAWSASTDGYVDAVDSSLERAAAQFRDALEKFRALG
jgi:hypothetical protein